MRVLLADDHRLLLEGLSNLLTAHDIEVVGQAHDGRQAIDLALQLRPDVILMDLRMPLCSGAEATRRILADLPRTRVVVLTTSEDEADLFEAVKSGAFGYLVKSMDTEELVTCLEQVQQGVPPFSPGLAAKLLAEFARLAASPPAQRAAVPAAAAEPRGQLTSRQREVLGLVAQGLGYKEVGRRLGISARTVKYHMAEIMASLHATHRSQVLAYAGRLGLAGRAGEG